MTDACRRPVRGIIKPRPVGDPELELRTDLLTALRAGPIPGEDDLSCAIALTHLVWGELLAYGTQGGQRLDEAQISLRMVLTSLSPP